MRTLRSFGTGTAILLLAGAAIGCTPSWEADWDIETVWLPAVYVTGETTVGVQEDYGRGTTIEWEASDPRLSGRVTISAGAGKTYPPDFEATGGAPPPGSVGAKTYTIVNDGGRWVGTATGLDLEAPEDFVLDTVILNGEGAYEGLTAYLLVDGVPDRDSPTFKGMLFPGPMPTVPPPLGGGAVLAAEPGEPVIAAPEPATGPLGRSYADWAASYAAWRFQQAEDMGSGEVVGPQAGPGGPADCKAGDLGDVLFAPALDSPDPIACEVAPDQRILLAVTFECPWDEDPVGCFSDAVFSDVSVSVDGRELAIDERFYYASSYEEQDLDEVGGHPGYYMMLEPLAPGEHVVLWGGMVEFGRGAASDEVQHAITVRVEEPSWE